MSHATALIVGNLGRDPEQRYTPSGAAVVTVAVATSRKRQNNETTTWWKATIWGKSGETLAQHFRKGDPILLEGEPYLESWQGRDGDTRQTLCLNASRWSFVGSGGSTPNQDYQAPAQASAEEPFNDGIPF